MLYIKLSDYFGGKLEGKTIAFLGLSFKPNAGDMLESPSVVITNLLTSAHIRAYDPVTMDEAKHQLEDRITYCASAEEAAHGVVALALFTDCTEFRMPDWDKVAEAMNGKVFFDGPNLYRRETLVQIGFD